jgi:hypothetical protein
MGDFEREQARLLSLWEELQSDNEDEISSDEGVNAFHQFEML